MTKNTKANIAEILLYSVIAIGYYLIISQYIRVQDDLIYSLRLDNGLPIDSFSDILESQCYGYAHQNGRFIIHTCTQILCSLGTMIPFYVVSTLCFVGLLAGCARLACGRRFGLYAIPLFAILLILIVPSPGATIYGHVAFVANYLWTSCAVVWFLVVYFNKHFNANALTHSMLFLFGVICGSLQESFSIGLCAGLVADYLINKDGRNKIKTLMALGFMFGSIVCILAPGNLLRAQGGGFESSIARRLVLVLGEGWFVWAVLTASVVWLLFRRPKAMEFVKSNVIMYVAIVANLAFAVLVAYTFRHQLFSQVMMSIVLVVGISKHLTIIPSQKTQIVVGVVALGAYIAMMFPIHSAREQLAQAYNSLWRQAEQQNNGTVCAKEYAELANSPFVYSFFSRYTPLIAANSIVYSTDGIRNLSNYVTRIDGANEIEIVLPDTEDNIVRQCTSDIGFTDSYFVVKKPLDAPDFTVRLIEKPAVIFSKMLNRISNKDYREKEILFNNIPVKLRHQGCEYGIIYRYSDNGYVIDDVKLQ